MSASPTVSSPLTSMAAPGNAMTREEVEQTIPLQIREKVMKVLAGYRNNGTELERLLKMTVKEDMTADNMSMFKAISLSLYDNNVPLPLVRNVFTELVKEMMAVNKDECFMAMSSLLMSIHHQVHSNHNNNNSRSFALEINLIEIRQRMSLIYHQSSNLPNNFSRAAQILSCIPIETLSELPDNGFSVNVRIAHLFIQAGLVEYAEVYLGRATTNLNNHNLTPADRLQHRICSARILDLKRRFEDAAHRYYMLANEDSIASSSGSPPSSSSSSNLLHLNHAITCAILAPAGPRRSRLLGMLYNDERSKKLDLFPLLQCIHMGRLLQKHHVDRLRPTLQPHQLNAHPDGDTVLDRAIIEHNMLAISRMYSNIGLDHLADLLNVSSEKAEKTARVMINEKRMVALIDQVEHVLQFTSQLSTVKIMHWDALIASLCAQVDDCVDAIVQKYPSFSSDTLISTPLPSAK